MNDSLDEVLLATEPIELLDVDKVLRLLNETFVVAFVDVGRPEAFGVLRGRGVSYRMELLLFNADVPIIGLTDVIGLIPKLLRPTIVSLRKNEKNA